MFDLPSQRSCRLSGEPLDQAPVLLNVLNCPLPGIYPLSVKESLPMRSPLRVVQAPGSGLVQLAHHFDSSMYEDYGFAADTSQGYRAHVGWFARALHAGLEPADSVLEVGCGDGMLLDLLQSLGHEHVIGIDPGRAAAAQGSSNIVCGYFPDGLPIEARMRRHERIVARHVLEHIEEPRKFIADLGACLADDGELWIEVPDLDATLAIGRWSNFYQLHCNYFNADTLDRLAATAGLGCVGGKVVDVFGGSLLRRYRRGSNLASSGVKSVAGAAKGFASFQDSLRRLAAVLPPRSVGYGAAERTALTLGACPLLEDRICALHDGNALLHGRRLAGTALEIRPSAELYDTGAEAVVLFAVSHREEILGEWRRRLSPSTLIAVTDGQCCLRALGDAGAR
jgi:SAM-dependent methyltransferase